MKMLRQVLVAAVIVAASRAEFQNSDEWLRQQMENAGLPLHALNQVRDEGGRVEPPWQEKARRRRAATSPAGEAAELSEKDVIGYDCSQPEALEAVAPRGVAECDGQVEAVSERNVTYLLLQEAKYHRVQIRSCRHVVSRLAFHCDKDSHATMVPHFSYLHRPREVSREECAHYWRLADTGEPLLVQHDAGKEDTNEPLVKNGIARWVQQTVGHQFPVPHQQARCYGGVVWEWGSKFPGIVATDFHELELLERKATVDEDGTLTLELEERVLKGEVGTAECTVHAQHCVAGEHGTFIWAAGNDYRDTCNLYRAREQASSGREVTTVDKNGREQVVFVSTDESMLRLVLGPRKERCGAEVRATDYSKLYVTEMAGVKDFQRPISPAEVSILTYANQQDTYLYHALGEFVLKEVNDALKEACLREVEAQEKRFAEVAAATRVRLDGDTAALGNGRFATASGEVWHTYSCREILARAVDKDDCFSALPVQIGKEDEARYWQRRGELPPEDVRQLQMMEMARRMNYTSEYGNLYNSTNAVQFYLEPVTRRLTTLGVIRPCVAGFEGRYKNRNGRWIAAHPYVTMADAPREILYKHTYSPIDTAAPGFHAESGGVYDFRTVLAHEQLLTNGRRGGDIVNRMAANAFEHRREWDSHPRTAGVTSLLDGLPAALGLGWISTLWEYLGYWSSFTSTLMSIYIALQLVRYVGGVCLRLAGAQVRGGLVGVLAGIQADAAGAGDAGGAAANAAPAALPPPPPPQPPAAAARARPEAAALADDYPKPMELYRRRGAASDDDLELVPLHAPVPMAAFQPPVGLGRAGDEDLPRMMVRVLPPALARRRRERDD